jgi:hypothetical protein
MFYRRKIMLALLEKTGGTLGRLKFQKLLFLIGQQQEKPAFDFVPYKFGAYSFRATADVGTMVKYSLLSTTAEKSWTKETEELFFPQLKKKDQQILTAIIYQHGNSSGRELIEYTYKKYPYYAINSTVAERYLNDDQLEEIDQFRPVKTTKEQLFTIGYEGISAEAYFNKLILNQVHALVDVRKNAASMKYGFHKSQLAHVCKSLGIAYYHIPEVGIENDKRRSLDTQADYDELFSVYRSEMLIKSTDAQEGIVSLFDQHERIALTCFEALPCQCHRSHLADHLEQTHSGHIPKPLHL